MKQYNVTSIIRKKRDGIILSDDEIHYMIKQYSNDDLPDYQMAAFLMAAFLNELTDNETEALTYSMLHSGKVLDLSQVNGVKVDKHSTGGVGDKISIILAPIVAACGVPVPMISGRGLGHTGGTLDKLESIPGFNVNLDIKRFEQILTRHNLVLIGQTEEIAPADKRLYALRDVTSTVESIPLIASSIMCKKLAEGIDALVLDIKFGSGAFMRKKENARKLAQKLISIGRSFNKEMIAYITNMDQPLGLKIGNWMEVEESIDCLKGKGPEDVMEVTHQLAGAMIYLGKKARSIENGIEMSKRSIEDGSAFQKLVDICTEQGGDIEYLYHPEKYNQSVPSFDITSSSDGFISQINAYEVGMAGVELGAGRKTKEDVVDPVAGIKFNFKVGDAVKKGETIAVCFTNKEEMVEDVKAMLVNSIVISTNRPKKEPMISAMLTGSNLQR
ncbi:MAG: thymidine phosphorylase [Balneolales bacterium]